MLSPVFRDASLREETSVEIWWVWVEWRHFPRGSYRDITRQFLRYGASPVFLTNVGAPTHAIDGMERYFSVLWKRDAVVLHQVLLTFFPNHRVFKEITKRLALLDNYVESKLAK